ncbi:hypothetical protein C8R46DRAFT_116798 [Mycena filopes]|nr:hypothetical protein C8R46DRAFT_116798 [Mycena filopes]
MGRLVPDSSRVWPCVVDIEDGRRKPFLPTFLRVFRLILLLWPRDVTTSSLLFKLPTHMALPIYVSERFDLFDRNTSDETEWYGPLNTLLGYLFLPEQYEVAPHPKDPIYLGPVHVESTALYIVRAVRGRGRLTTKHPICFLEINPAGRLHNSGARAAADRHMRATFERLVERVVIPKLVGFSMIGSRFAVYECDGVSRELTPAGIPRDLRVVNDTAPAARWAHDFLDAGEGEAKLLEVVRSIRDMCDAL